jgi:hypothetical protein
MKYDCGCVNEIDENSGILRSVDKCQTHSQVITTSKSRDKNYYMRGPNSAIDEDGIPNFVRYIKELGEGVSREDFSYLTDGLGRFFLELGAGLGPYIPLLLSGGGRYLAIDDSRFACEWIRRVFYVPCLEQDVETIPDDIHYDCVLAAHLLEHVWDAPGLLRKMHKIARERIYLIVPDDSDPVNPDHRWFFTRETLQVALKRAGFRNIRSKIQRIVPQENFIYTVAEK